jgi:hypothetical protein
MIGHGDGSSTTLSPIIDQTSVGDAEHPRTELLAASLECGDVAEDAEENLTRQIVGIVGTLSPQVRDNVGSEPGIQRTERRPGPKAGADEHSVEFFVDHGAFIPQRQRPGRPQSGPPPSRRST